MQDPAFSLMDDVSDMEFKPNRVIQSIYVEYQALTFHFEVS